MTTITINLDKACTTQVQDLQRIQLSADNLVEAAVAFSSSPQGYQQFIQARKDLADLLEDLKTNYRYVVIK